MEADKAVSDIMNSCYLKWKAQTAGMKQAKRTFERSDTKIIRVDISFPGDLQNILQLPV